MIFLEYKNNNSSFLTGKESIAVIPTLTDKLIQQKCFQQYADWLEKDGVSCHDGGYLRLWTQETWSSLSWNTPHETASFWSCEEGKTTSEVETENRKRAGMIMQRGDDGGAWEGGGGWSRMLLLKEQWLS